MPGPRLAPKENYALVLKGMGVKPAEIQKVMALSNSASITESSRITGEGYRLFSAAAGKRTQHRLLKGSKDYLEMMTLVFGKRITGNRKDVSFEIKRRGSGHKKGYHIFFRIPPTAKPLTYVMAAAVKLVKSGRVTVPGRTKREKIAYVVREFQKYGNVRARIRKIRPRVRITRISGPVR